MELPEALARARENSRYSQDDIGAALGVSRAMVSYWESGKRRPNDRQLSSLAWLYGIPLIEILEGHDVKPVDASLTQLMLRSDPDIDPQSVPGLREFVQFLERYGELANVLSIRLHGMRQSPFVHRRQFSQQADARRKAEEVRAHLRLGIGPILDINDICERLGITVYQAALGTDLRHAPSGAFLNHPQVGFSVLVNLNMTPGRRRFTTAHELGHALFHSNDLSCVVSRVRSPRERFADIFASEFLMPSEGIRRFIEESGMPPRIIDPIDVIHIQRYFRVSWPTALVRMRHMRAIDQETFRELRYQVRPVSLAQNLGYQIEHDEIHQDPERWRIRRFPRRFLRLLRQAVLQEVMSVPSAAAFAGLVVPEIVSLLGHHTGSKDTQDNYECEFNEFEHTGVI